MDAVLNKCFFSIYWYKRVDFLFCIIYVIYYIYWFVNVVPSFHPWDESHLTMVYDLFNVLLDTVCQYVVEDFRVYVHQQYLPVVFFLCCVFIWFWNTWSVSFVKGDKNIKWSKIISSSINGVGRSRQLHAKQTNKQTNKAPKNKTLDYQLTPHTRINSRYIKDLSISHDTINVL